MKKFPILFVLVFPFFVNAQTINEILYSPSTKQWVEIYNSTENPIDLSQYKILDSGASVNGHSITAISGGSIPAHSYGIIAKNPDDFSGASYPLYKASLGRIL